MSIVDNRGRGLTLPVGAVRSYLHDQTDKPVGQPLAAPRRTGQPDCGDSRSDHSVWPSRLRTGSLASNVILHTCLGCCGHHPCGESDQEV